MSAGEDVKALETGGGGKQCEYMRRHTTVLMFLLFPLPAVPFPPHLHGSSHRSGVYPQLSEPFPATLWKVAAPPKLPVLACLYFPYSHLSLTFICF